MGAGQGRQSTAAPAASCAVCHCPALLPPPTSVPALPFATTTLPPTHRAVYDPGTAPWQPLPGTDLYANFDDLDGHGTHTAGTVGAVGDNGAGLTGAAWNVSLHICKAESDNGQFYGWAALWVSLAVGWRAGEAALSRLKKPLAAVGCVCCMRVSAAPAHAAPARPTASPPRPAPQPFATRSSAVLDCYYLCRKVGPCFAFFWGGHSCQTNGHGPRKRTPSRADGAHRHACLPGRLFSTPCMPATCPPPAGGRPPQQQLVRRQRLLAVCV